MTETNVKPIRNEDGTYDFLGFRIERVHNRKWVITRPGHDFEGSTESLKKATDAILNINSEEADAATEELERQAKVHAEQVGEQTKGKTAKEVISTSSDSADSKLVGHKITVGIIHDIRSGFDALVGGKVAYYRTKAKEHKLGVETVAKIARRDIYKQVD